MFLFHLVVKCYGLCDFFNQSNDYTTFSTTCIKFYVIIKCCVKFCVIITACVIICGVAKEGFYDRSNSFPSCCDISATLSCNTSA